MTCHPETTKPYRSLIARACLALANVLLFSAPSASAAGEIQLELSTDVYADHAASAGAQTNTPRGWRSKSAWVLANIDDDARRCTPELTIQDLRASACNDSTDSVVNGANDLADLAPVRLKAWPKAPPRASARVDIAPNARAKSRLFVWRGGQWVALNLPALFSAQELHRGLEMRLEATDIVRERRVWDGSIDLSVRVASGGSTKIDYLRFRVAPLIVQSDTAPLRRFYVPGMPWAQDGLRTRSLPPRGVKLKQNAFGYLSILDAANPSLSASRRASFAAEQSLGLLGRAFKAFREDFDAAVRLAQPLARTVELSTFEDPWVQDMFQTTFASVPRPNGNAHIMYVALRSAQPQRSFAKLPLAETLGPDVGIVEQWADDSGEAPANGDWSLNSTGNFGTIPPYAYRGKRYALGRLLYGAGLGWVQTGGGIIDSSIGGGELKLQRRAPDESFMKMLKAQRLQPPVAIDTAWLAVGHIDEIVAFVPATNARGWKLVLADPALAWRSLQAIVARGGASTPFRSGLEPWAEGLVPEELTRTVLEVVNDARIAQAQLIAQRKIAAALATLKRETGIRDHEIIRVPVLFEPTPFNERSFVGLTPNAVNLVALSKRRVAVARQHGPLVDGQDVYEEATAAAFRAHGIEVSWVEDFIQAHGGHGEIHCQSNTLRHPGELARWWRYQR